MTDIPQVHLTGGAGRAVQPVAQVPSPREEGISFKYRLTWLYFATVTLALVILVAGGGALSWDGSYVLFRLLDGQQPFIDQNRSFSVPLQWLVILTSHITNNISVLALVYGAVHAVLPLLSLVVSWWIVRRTAPYLFVWAAFGIGIGTLVGQLSSTTEAIIAIQLSWPILLCVLTGVKRDTVPLLLALTVVEFFTHPLSIVLLGLAAVLSLLMAIRFGQLRARMLLWSCFFLVLSAVAVVQFTFQETTYEADQLSLATLQAHFHSISGLPFIALSLSWIAAILIFVTSSAKRLRQRNSTITLHSLALISVLGAGILLAIWASNSYNWRFALQYRTWALPCSMPFMALAALEALMGNNRHRELGGVIEMFWRWRVTQATAWAFLLTLSIQSASWHSISVHLQESMNSSSSACISASTTKWLLPTPLNHWSVTPYSLLLAGQTPTKIVVLSDNCDGVYTGEGLRMAKFNSDNQDLHTGPDGWFNLKPLEESLQNP